MNNRPDARRVRAIWDPGHRHGDRARQRQRPRAKRAHPPGRLRAGDQAHRVDLATIRGLGRGPTRATACPGQSGRLVAAGVGTAG